MLWKRQVKLTSPIEFRIIPLGLFPSILLQYNHILSSAYWTFMAKMFYNHLHWCLCWHCSGNTFWLRPKSLEKLLLKACFWWTRVGYNSFLNKQQKQRGLHPACFSPNCHEFKNVPERVQYSFLLKTPRHYSFLLTAFPI